MAVLSTSFFAFVVAVLVAYYAAGRLAPRWQWVVLLVASLSFYCLAGDVGTLWYMAVSSVCSWGAALVMGRVEAEGKAARKAVRDRAERKLVRARYARRKRAVLVAALVACLGLLFYPKYFNTLLFELHLTESVTSLGILLPLGISFYTFQSLGYVIDVYNANDEPETNYARYLLFVSYFPQIVQGPINRHSALAPQLFEARRLDLQKFRRGLLRLGFGLLKVVCLGNVISGFVKAAVGDVTPDTPGVVVVVGVLAYSIQMYGDFSGGIDVVEGVSELLGIEMAQNFRQPYFSTSLSDFWRRWHMSLGAWIRDYVFYPLALTKWMQRFGKWAGRHLGRHAGRTLPACLANVIAFLIVGLWHGVEYHYLLWGLYNGVVVALADLLAPAFSRLTEALHVRRESAGFHAFSILRTFVVVNVGRYFDCITSVHQIWYALRNTVCNFAPEGVLASLASAGFEGAFPLWGTWPQLAFVLVSACAIVFAVSVGYERGGDVRARVLSWKAPVRGLVYVLAGLLVVWGLALDTSGGRTFLYANF